jgi:hypothetical protein
MPRVTYSNQFFPLSPPPDASPLVSPAPSFLRPELGFGAITGIVPALCRPHRLHHRPPQLPLHCLSPFGPPPPCGCLPCTASSPREKSVSSSENPYPPPCQVLGAESHRLPYAACRSRADPSTMPPSPPLRWTSTTPCTRPFMSCSR